MKTVIQVDGQDTEETNRAIQAFEDLKNNNAKYISFGNNLILASEVVHMLQSGFKATWDINSDSLYFKKGK